MLLTTAESHLVCQHGDDLVWTHVDTGQVAATLDGDGDSILAFGCAPNDTDVVVACRSGLIKHFTVDLATASAAPVLVRSFKGTLH